MLVLQIAKGDFEWSRIGDEFVRWLRRVTGVSGDAF